MPKSRKVQWSVRFQRDLEEIAALIAEDRPTASYLWIQRLRQAVYDIAKMPFAARRVPEVQKDEYREIFRGRYRIVFEVRAESILVVAIIHGSRRFSESFFSEAEEEGA